MDEGAAEVQPITEGNNEKDVQPAEEAQEEDVQAADNASVALTADATVASAIGEAVAFVEEEEESEGNAANAAIIESEGADNIDGEQTQEHQEDLVEPEQEPDTVEDAQKETVEPEQETDTIEEAQKETVEPEQETDTVEEAQKETVEPEQETDTVEEAQKETVEPEQETDTVEEAQKETVEPEQETDTVEEAQKETVEPEQETDEPQHEIDGPQQEADGLTDEPPQVAGEPQLEAVPEREEQPTDGPREAEGEQVPDSSAEPLRERTIERKSEQEVADAVKEEPTSDGVPAGTVEISEAKTGGEVIEEPQDGLIPTAKPSTPDVMDNTVQLDDNDFSQGFNTIDSNAAATVKFMLMPCAQVTTRRCFLSETVLQLKEHFAEELRIPASVILLLFDGQALSNELTLLNMGVGPNSTVQLEMQSADPVNTPIKAFKPRQEYHMPDVITVRVPAEVENQMMDIVVEIERCTQKKPFLGGYRHKETGTEYHHASAQTNKKVKPAYIVDHFCRDTQTIQEKLQHQQTTNNMTTQMTKVGVFVVTATDHLVAPGLYTTADEFHARRLQQVIVIQKYYRRWLARCYVQQVREAAQHRLDWEREQELRKKKEKEDRIRREFERRMNPKSKEDFDLLYHALEKWRQEEVVRINEELCGAERKAALCQLLEKETQLIASIGQHKIDANIENKNESIKNFLDKTAAPKRWCSYDGRVMAMATPYTLRASELKEIYNSINMKYLTQDERLDVLLTLKCTVKEHNCKLTLDLLALVDREADLLSRGVQETNLVGLRKRISTLFLQYIKTPSFNPEAARMIKVPQDPLELIENIYYCSCCNQYLPSSDFQLSTNSNSVGHCRLCRQTDNIARQRQDLSHYRYMLQALRKSEEAYDDESSIAFLMQENDLRHLVENVWSSQSSLSAWEDLYDLVLVRWDKSKEWSPWNCVLLTKEEATAHNKLSCLTEAYGKIFIQKVQHKQTLARNYFSRLPGMADQLRRHVSSKSKRRAPYVTGIGVKQPVK